ncbi:conserved hypothetical protein [Vibrio chagasii]|nr:conserved hypothetical protein [Vibrio chagasii]
MTTPKEIKVGSTSVTFDIDVWEKHGRRQFAVRILCKDDPFSDNDSIRSKTTTSEVEEVLDWLIENEAQNKLKGYTMQEAKNISEEINRLTANLY